ncbi:MAG: nitroreductase family deazaflavin-dependent oxidoreductase [Cryobacterium sp.]|nr:nitroreductase family deazaflavin-dependent oxidoreductase [Cryobacterium sp.]
MAGKVGARVLRTRWLVRAPIVLFRCHLGFLFVGRLLLLEHLGRSSGKARFVTLEVLSRINSHQIVIASGLGRKAQWFQNVAANPACRVSIGFRYRAKAVATVLDADEASSLLANYQRAHPRLWSVLDDAMTQLHGSADYELPLVRLDLD